jgi:predicted site-specific integrase-resolvase
MTRRAVDIETASKAAGVSVRTIYRWIDAGLLHPSDGLVDLDEIDSARARRAYVALVKRLTL